MSLVVFKHRRTLPVNPDIGTFYWIDKDNDTSELWFGSRNGLIRLDNYFDRSEIEDIISRLSGVESDTESIQEILNGIDFDDFLTSSDFVEIDERVNDKLTWKII